MPTEFRSLSFLSNHLIWLLILVSAATHVITLSLFSGPLFGSPPKPEYVEVELIYPEPVPPPPPVIKVKKPPVVIAKPKPAPIEKKATIVAKEETPPPKAIVQPKAEIVKPLPQPKPKPSLTIESDLNTSAAPQPRVASETQKRELHIPRISVPVSDRLSDLPERETSGAFSDTITTSNQKPRIESQATLPGIKGEDIKSKDLTRGADGEKIRIDLKTSDKTVAYRIVEDVPDPTSPVPLSAADPQSDSVLEGEVRQRKILEKPDPPELDIEKTVTVTLAFTVLPNGVVDQIVPIRKADPRLEAVAINLLREYRFEPLFESETTQQGIIHFMIRRKK